MNKSINKFFALSTILIFSACSSVQITEEAVGDQSVAGVSITSKSTATRAVLANAVVYFEYDQFNLTAKSIQALKGVSELMKRNSKITISIEGHADERGTRLISSLSIAYPFSHLENSFNTAVSRQSNLLIKPVDM